MRQQAEASFHQNDAKPTSGAALAGFVSDEAIVSRVQAGDASAFELIMRRYNQRIFRVVRAILGDNDEAEDVVQDAYVRAYEHLDQFEGRAKFSTWLTKIAIYEANARRRRLNRVRLVDPSESGNDSMEPQSLDTDPLEAVSRRELRDVLAWAVDQLPADLRTVFTMRMIEGLDTNETAECLDLTASNVKVRVHRARVLLRKQIDQLIGKEARQLYQFDGERCDRIVQAVLKRLL